MPDPTCAELHTPLPTDPAERAFRNAELIQTHTRTRCPVCGLFAIWLPQSPTVDHAL